MILPAAGQRPPTPYPTGAAGTKAHPPQHHVRLLAPFPGELVQLPAAGSSTADDTRAAPTDLRDRVIHRHTLRSGPRMPTWRRGPGHCMGSCRSTTPVPCSMLPSPNASRPVARQVQGQGRGREARMDQPTVAAVRAALVVASRNGDAVEQLKLTSWLTQLLAEQPSRQR